MALRPYTYNLLPIYIIITVLLTREPDQEMTYCYSGDDLSTRYHALNLRVWHWIHYICVIVRR
jgi:hypothetical protein